MTANTDWLTAGAGHDARTAANRSAFISKKIPFEGAISFIPNLKEQKSEAWTIRVQAQLRYREAGTGVILTLVDVTPGWLNGKGVHAINAEAAFIKLNFFFLRTLTFLLSLNQRSCKMYHILDLIVSSRKYLDLIFLAKGHTSACTAGRGASPDHFVKVITPRSLHYKGTFPLRNY